MAAKQETPNPKTTSSDYQAMADYWKMVGAILHGVDAMRMSISGGRGAVAGPAVPYASLMQLSSYRRGRSAASSPFLPQLPNEENIDYDFRRKNAPLTNIYNDISKNLASKPFSKTCQLDEATPDDLKTLSENIDGQGNSLHVFAADTFKNAIDKGIDWILVDFDSIPPPKTLADERERGAKPYWVHIPAERLLAVYSAFIGGQEIITHARIYECAIERDGEYDETTIERVRVFNRMAQIDATDKIIGYGPALWELHELVISDDQADKGKQEWVLVDGGAITIGIIPLVPFTTNKRDGSSWKVTPPLKDVAYMQVEEFQQESNLKTVKEMTAFPMLAGNGVAQPSNDKGESIMVPVGPRAVLFAPPSVDGRSNGEWKWIEPTAASLTFLETSLEKFRNEMRDLGMQPLATANLTVITTANVSMKAHNAVQAWALGLKDALEQAWLITCMWLNQKGVSPVVKVHTDFGVDFEAGQELDTLNKARAAKDLSQRTYWAELQRRGTLSDDFDADMEEEAIAEEQQGLVPEIPIDPVTGKPIIDPMANRSMPVLKPQVANKPAPTVN